MFASFLTVLAAVSLADAASRVEGQLVLDGVPDIPPEVAERTSQYENVRSAGLVGWLARSAGLMVTTRFGETSQLHTVAGPGMARKQVTFFSEPVASAGWDPEGDGTSVVYARDVGGGEAWQLFRFDLRSGVSTLLTDGSSRNELGAWANTGDRFAFSSTRRNQKDFDLYVMDAADPASARRVLEVEGQWNVLDWSADDARLLVRQFTSAVHSRLYVLDLGTGQLVEVSPMASPATWDEAVFAEGGAAIFATTDGGGEFRRLVRVELASNVTTVLTADIPWDVEALAMAPDLRQLAFTVNEAGRSAVYVAASGAPEHRKRLAIPLGVAGGLAFDAAGKRLALSISTAQAPTDVYVLDLKKQTSTRWTESEVGGLDTSRFVVPELVAMPSFDGLEVPAWVYRPATANGPSPVVISIHGGPESQSRDSFVGTFQYWVNELGLTVVVPNVRGSSGYGRSYLTLDDGRKRMDSVKDIGAVLDWIGTQSGLDASRVGVTGGSYGGFMVLASLVAFPDRLRCGIDSVGISNFVSFLENTDAYRRDLRRVEYGDERDPAMRAFLQEVSPLNNVGRISDPLFVVQGRNDPRVPMSEAEQIVSALRQKGQDVWYLLANDEGHGFKRKSNRDVMTRATTLFFERYLIASGATPAPTGR
ncbi:MAG: S9 family peptidase [Myxococcales bacterium]|nr:S9 family peptidase [Myxococcales bacterium]